jgi:aspartyl-tRNA(Asn)/glutamyl-tRNA(Gln) amidotransferase subunit A
MACRWACRSSGGRFDEQGVLNAGLAIEQRAQFSAKPEKWW